MMNKLKNQDWFSGLNPSDKKMIKDQAKLIFQQNLSVTKIDNLDVKLIRIKNQVQLTQEIAKYSRYVDNVDGVKRKFNRINKGELNNFVNDSRLRYFMESAFDPA